MAKKAPKKTDEKGAKRLKKVGPVTEVTKSRHISDTDRFLLWGRAAGRCEFAGCNREVWKNPTTQEPVNIAEAAHIYSFSDDGPRGNKGIAEDDLNRVDNLMLACHDCHKTMDRKNDGGRYTVELLKEWKFAHEKRVEVVTGVDPKKSSHVLLYGAAIGEDGSHLNYSEAAHALFPERYPAEARPIGLGMKETSDKDKEKDYWKTQSKHLKKTFDRKVRERIESGEISHLSVFGLAPQPLLIQLGTELIDIISADVFQRHREPPTWKWPDGVSPLQFDVIRPDSFDGPPALVIALTANVTADRITSVLGENAAIWSISIPNPNNDHIKCREDLSNFRKLVRPLLDEIKARHGQDEPLHIFPVAGNSVSIELGRIRQPKALMPWKLYDQIPEQGFVHVLDIN